MTLVKQLIKVGDGSTVRLKLLDAEGVDIARVEHCFEVFGGIMDG